MLNHEEYKQRRDEILNLHWTNGDGTIASFTSAEAAVAIDALVKDYSEVWLPVSDYEGYYEVSNYGGVRITSTRKPMKLRISNMGYPRVSLYKDGVNKGFNVHRLVAKAFVPNYTGKKCVNHIDSDRQNNRWDNLEWVTYQENTQHAVDKGRVVYAQSHIHYKNSKFTTDDLVQIFEMKAQGISTYVIADKFDAGYTTVNDVLKGRTYAYDTIELRKMLADEQRSIVKGGE